MSLGPSFAPSLAVGQVITDLDDKMPGKEHPDSLLNPKNQGALGEVSGCMGGRVSG